MFWKGLGVIVTTRREEVEFVTTVEGVTTLYDWLMGIKGMSEHNADTLDRRVPFTSECPTPQDLWARSDSKHQAPYDAKMMEAVYGFLSDLHERCSPGESLYLRISSHAYKTGLKSGLVPEIAKARARRKAAQVFLGHVWEAAYRLETGHPSESHYDNQISPEIPYPDVD